MSYRSYIRKAISQIFFRYIYETGRHNGIGELLEILGSIVNGFAIPLKKEHLQFLERALIPLHKPRNIALYHPQLSYCISQFVEKDPDTIVPIVQGLARFWPWNCPSKQVILFIELFYFNLLIFYCIIISFIVFLLFLFIVIIRYYFLTN